ncbi:molybdopterin-binding protein [Afipia carboxidovorans]|uniref:molybdopterin-binding protein n=1 Tax=Afipia carboxidovorans TaxID=40137 RepID=UPI00308F9A30|nr:molybdopterin-binding protein [Afipia carboxidovorans]
MKPLVSLDDALAGLLEGLAPVQEIFVPVVEAVGSIAAAMAPLGVGVPQQDTAMRDGWALSSRDLVGATSYAPAFLPNPPLWIEAGQPMPEGCDCIVDPDLVEVNGPLAQVTGEASPGAGVRRAGGDIAQGASIIAPGSVVRPLDAALACAAGLSGIAIRKPRVTIVDVVSSTDKAVTSDFIAALARRAGAAVSLRRMENRNMATLVATLETEADLLVFIGGTGEGRDDNVAAAISSRGALLAHSIAIAPGTTALTGRMGGLPILALPGRLDQALSAWLLLALPVLARLSARSEPPSLSLPLVRKISSAPGMAEIVLLKRDDMRWMPLAIGDLPLSLIAEADAWLVVPGESEGYAAGTACRGFLLVGYV